MTELQNRYGSDQRFQQGEDDSAVNAKEGTAVHLADSSISLEIDRIYDLVMKRFVTFNPNTRITITPHKDLLMPKNLAITKVG